MGYTKTYVEARIKKLSAKPVENAKIINKWKRILSNLEK